MFGAIIGDTVGSVYEFNNTKDYNFELLTPRSIYTDDSIMSLAVAEWLLTDEDFSPEGLQHYLVDYGHRYPTPMGGYGGRFHSWLFGSESERVTYGSWGNGSAMRASAVGWCFDSLEATELVAAFSATITHSHPEGIKGAQATAVAIYLARTGSGKQEIKDCITELYGYDLDLDYDNLRATYGWEDSCQKTVPQAIACFLQSTDFEDAIRKAVSIGGDSDTLACITGGIAEAYYKEIPEEIRTTVWSKLPKGFKETIQAVADRTAYKDIFNDYGLKIEY